MADDWMWWAGAHNDLYTVGPLPTKEAAIDEMVNDGAGEPFDDSEFAHIFHITEATNPPLMLKDYIRTDTLLEAATDYAYDCDRVSSEYDDDVFAVTPAQDADLRERIEKACDEWQKAHKLTFTTSTFHKQRSQEVISIPKTKKTLAE